MDNRRGGRNDGAWRGPSAASDRFDAEIGVEMAYLAMFGEVDEATAIFQVTNTPPTQAPFQPCKGLPREGALRLVGQRARLLREEQPAQASWPIQPNEEGER